MADKKSSESRRKLLKSIAAGSGVIVAGKSLPESWSRPVVDSVMLPAHAQTSPPPPAAGCGTLTITNIIRTPPGGGATPVDIQCGDTVNSNVLTFSFNVTPVPPSGTTVSLNGCMTAAPVPVDGSGNAQMDLQFGNTCTNDTDHTLEFSIGCGTPVSCVLRYLT